jgi:hypothetical protein
MEIFRLRGKKKPARNQKAPNFLQRRSALVSFKPKRSAAHFSSGDFQGGVFHKSQPFDDWVLKPALEKSCNRRRNMLKRIGIIGLPLIEIENETQPFGVPSFDRRHL